MSSIDERKIEMIEMSCTEFVRMLASSSPVPGGGGASALVGAIGTALGSMVANLTSGKKKYESVQNDIEEILKKAEKLQHDLLRLVEADAEVFEPLSKAYGLPRNTDEEKKNRDEVMEDALKNACSVPLLIMRAILEAIPLHEELASKGSKIMVSDVGVGILFCKAALLGAALNVFINTKMMKDRQYASGIEAEADRMIEAGVKKADDIYGNVAAQIRRQ